jgi:hypothetical protein
MTSKLINYRYIQRLSFLAKDALRLYTDFYYSCLLVHEMPREEKQMSHGTKHEREKKKQSTQRGHDRRTEVMEAVRWRRGHERC